MYPITLCHIFSSEELQAVSLSLQIALCCTFISVPIAMLVGYLLARKEFVGKALVESIIHLPLVMPPVTTGYLLLLLLGVKGWIGEWLFEWLGWRIAFGFWAAVIASVVVSLPLVVRSVRTAIEMVDEGFEEASMILGAGRIKTFFNITMPLALPGIIAGVVLGFARSLGEFGATITFAGNIEGVTQTLPLAIYSYMQVPGQEGATLKLALISVAISFIAMGISEGLITKMKKQQGI